MSDVFAIEDQAKSKPDVITVADMSGKRIRFVCYPAIKAPRRKPILLIRPEDDEPRPASNHADAMKIATVIVKNVVSKARAALRAKATKGKGRSGAASH